MELGVRVRKLVYNVLIASELKCGVWDNGLFCDFGLAKMQEIPGQYANMIEIKIL